MPNALRNLRSQLRQNTLGQIGEPNQVKVFESKVRMNISQNDIEKLPRQSMAPIQNTDGTFLPMSDYDTLG